MNNAHIVVLEWIKDELIKLNYDVPIYNSFSLQIKMSNWPFTMWLLLPFHSNEIKLSYTGLFADKPAISINLANPKFFEELVYYLQNPQLIYVN